MKVIFQALTRALGGQGAVAVFSQPSLTGLTPVMITCQNGYAFSQTPGWGAEAQPQRIEEVRGRLVAGAVAVESSFADFLPGSRLSQRPPCSLQVC